MFPSVNYCYFSVNYGSLSAPWTKIFFRVVAGFKDCCADTLCLHTPQREDGIAANHLLICLAAPNVTC